MPSKIKNNAKEAVMHETTSTIKTNESSPDPPLNEEAKCQERCIKSQTENSILKGLIMKTPSTENHRRPVIQEETASHLDIPSGEHGSKEISQNQIQPKKCRSEKIVSEMFVTNTEEGTFGLPHNLLATNLGLNDVHVFGNNPISTFTDSEMDTETEVPFNAQNNCQTSMYDL
jgi:hypothetical protein